MKSTRHDWNLDGIKCANCANKIERSVQKMDGILNASLDFANSKLRVEVADGYNPVVIRANVERVMSVIEPGCSIVEKENRKDESWSISKNRIILYASGAVFFAVGLALPSGGIEGILLFILAYIVFGSGVIAKSLKNIVRGRIFDENFLMTIATVGAFILGEFPEGAAVMMFYQTGELFQDYAVDRTRRSIKKLMGIKPEFANLMTGDGSERVPPSQVKPGDVIVIRPGERVPLDGVIIGGSSALDTSPLTGESLPRDVGEGDEILSGCINQTGLLTVRVLRSFGQSAVSRILELVEQASGRKAVTERFITRFAAWYTPIVTGLAVLLALVPPLVSGGAYDVWLYRALVFLVISCPCALVISIPLGFFGGIGAASRNGILVKGGNYLEALARVGAVVFDKTGTLTSGSFEVFEVVPEPGISENELIEIAALAESRSTHPLALSVVKRYGSTPDFNRVEDYREFAGRGVRALIDGKTVLCGSARLMADHGITPADGGGGGVNVYVAAEGRYLGRIGLRDTIKPDAAATVDRLARMGIEDIIMLTGDEEAAAGDIAGRTGIKKFFSRLLPQDKVARLEQIMESRTGSRPVAFVGDGINDAAVIARADIGVAMGGMGSDAAVEAADVVIMNDEPRKICDAVAIARKTKAVVYQNIVMALVVKFVFLALGAGGIASLWEAVFADVGVALLAVLNAMRTYSYKV
jgi:Cd2+/Zn2+-exporting ATPase